MSHSHYKSSRSNYRPTARSQGAASATFTPCATGSASATARKTPIDSTHWRSQWHTHQALTLVELPAVSMRKREAFTLVELLVVIAIIGILVSLLLPAVQQARESARRVSCTSNIKQLGVALQNYEVTHRQLPRAGDYGPLETAASFDWYWRIDLKSGNNYSWIVHLLPFLEEQSLYDQFDLKRHVIENPTNPQSAQPPVLLCPTDGAYRRMFTSAAIPAYPGNDFFFGKGNYAAFVNPFHIDSYFNPGAIALYGQPLIKVTDGTSSTLVFAEIRTRDNMNDARGAWALPMSGTSLLSMDLHPQEWNGSESDVGDEASTYDPDSKSFGLTQYPNSVNPDVLYRCPDYSGEQIDAMPCTYVWRGYISAAPRSLHPGGVMAVFLDGHVAFLPNDIDELAMFYMIHISDGQNISERY